MREIKIPRITNPDWPNKEKIDKEINGLLNGMHESLNDLVASVSKGVIEQTNIYIITLLTKHGIKTRDPRYVKQQLTRKHLVLEIEQPYYKIDVKEEMATVTMDYTKIRIREREE